jgi:hypothetical protein
VSAWLPCHVPCRKRDRRDSHIPKKGHLCPDIDVPWVAPALGLRAQEGGRRAGSPRCRQVPPGHADIRTPRLIQEKKSARATAADFRARSRRNRSMTDCGTSNKRCGNRLVCQQRARLVTAVPYGPRAGLPSAPMSQRHEGVEACRRLGRTKNSRA